MELVDFGKLQLGSSGAERDRGRAGFVAPRVAISLAAPDPRYSLRLAVLTAIGDGTQTLVWRLAGSPLPVRDHGLTSAARAIARRSESTPSSCTASYSSESFPQTVELTAVKTVLVTFIFGSSPARRRVFGAPLARRGCARR